ncbi:5'-methylthioadenosine/adenosylhomocysteine nucleosidase [Massilia rubra]|uniref:adenosylhomocysteine nucleosidase n=1 Tax=Massilia rubra TaxID=2607910 RepID=A0ABX0LTJ5_9BURK|nr:5'-methylthioadenosine/adenosylhomocysteine nucleosidase [Massilia rubra]NHZ38171.1 5'-methylthioadenosine/adenosylhomocysteine nucleosidase [Massilia rubra]
MNSGKNIRLGIISALHEEQEGLVEGMQGPATLIHGMRNYASGQVAGIDAVCVLSRIGKVAAAMTATTLVEKYGVTHILFTGVAGAGDAGVKVGDIVVAESLVQYDMDASPLFPRFEVPLTGLSHFQSDLQMSQRAASAALEFLDKDFETAIDDVERAEFGLERPRVHRGLIASGDQFISKRAHLAQLNGSLPGLLAVEMEGAAVAQVCFELGIPFAVIRTISDNANEEAATDFMRFVKSVASRYAFHIVTRFCAELKSGRVQASRESAGV